MPKCLECGYIHPTTTTGDCPMAREQKIDEDIQMEQKNILGDCLLTIKEDFIKNLKGADESDIKRVTAKIRNLIFNYAQDTR